MRFTPLVDGLVVNVLLHSLQSIVALKAGKTCVVLETKQTGRNIRSITTAFVLT